MAGVSLLSGQVIRCNLDPTTGREQGGRRPCVVISSFDYTQVVTHLAIVLPCTTRQRPWDNHVLLTGPTGLTRPTFAMTEQPRTVSVERIESAHGYVDGSCLATLTWWLDLWLQAA